MQFPIQHFITVLITNSEVTNKPRQCTRNKKKMKYKDVAVNTSFNTGLLFVVFIGYVLKQYDKSLVTTYNTIEKK